MEMQSGSLTSLALALGIGLLIGVERERRKGHGPRRAFAGVRSFTLVALMGGLLQWLNQVWLVALAGGLVVTLAAIAYWRDRSRDPGITTELALFVTFVLGVLTVPYPAVAAAGGVVVVALLAGREPLQHFSTRTLSAQELRDALVLAAAALIVLPLTPDRSLTWLAGVNPRAVWYLVVLIMGVQALGHVAQRLHPHDEHHQVPDRTRIHTSQPGQGPVWRQRQHNQRRRSQHQSIAQLLGGQRAGGEMLQGLTACQQRHHHHPACSRHSRVRHGEHPQHKGDKQRQLGGDARIARTIAPIRDSGQGHHQPSRQRNQPHLVQPLEQAPHECHQGKAAHARKRAPRPMPFATLSLYADQKTDAQGQGQRSQRTTLHFHANRPFSAQARHAMAPAWSTPRPGRPTQTGEVANAGGESWRAFNAIAAALRRAVARAGLRSQAPPNAPCPKSAGCGPSPADG